MARWTQADDARVRSNPPTRALDRVQVVGYMFPTGLGAPSIRDGCVPARSDLLYEMLMAASPSAADSGRDVLNVIGTATPAPRLGHRARRLDAIVARAMSKEIAGRHQSAAEFSAELRSGGALPTCVRRRSPVSQPLDDATAAAVDPQMGDSQLRSRAAGLLWWWFWVSGSCSGNGVSCGDGSRQMADQSAPS